MTRTRKISLCALLLIVCADGGLAEEPPAQKLTVLVRDKMEKPLPGVQVLFEWVNAEDWPYGEMGKAQRTWPVPPPQSIGVLGHATVTTDEKGLATLKRKASEPPVGFFLSYQKEGYNPIHRSPTLKTYGPGKHFLDGPTLSPADDCVTLTGQVLDAETRKPIRDAVIADLGYWHYWRRREVWKVDDEGRFKITTNVRHHNQNDSPDPTIQAKGYPIQAGEWLDEKQEPIDFDDSNLAGKTLEHVRVLLKKGVFLPGRIATAEGKPVADATLKWEPVRWHYVAHTTDADGRFQFGPVLKESDWPHHYGPSVDITWPGFVAAQQARLDVKKGYPKEWIISLPAMKLLCGRIVDEQGNPVTRARIDVGREMGNWIHAPARDCPEGTFHIDAPVDPFGPGFVLGVRADGFAPQVVEWSEAQAADPDTVITLKKGLPCGGVVVDEAGNPIQKVWITSENVGASRRIKIGASTDMNGAFHLARFPTDIPVNFSILKEGYMAIRDAKMTPGKTDHRFVLKRPMKVSGCVTDAQMGKPVEDFNVISGIDWGQGSAVSWQRGGGCCGGECDTCGGGKYELEFSYPYPYRLLRIEAEGYKPAVSRRIKSDEGNVEINFSLEKGENLCGTLLGPDGKPLAEANVYLVLAGNAIGVKNGKVRRKENCPQTQTGTDGEFSFSPQVEDYLLLALHESGCAQARAEEFQKSQKLTLQPWARVMGVMHVGAKPASGEQAQMWMHESRKRNEPRVYWELSAQADEQGKFELACVPEGRGSVGRHIQLGPNRSTTTHAVMVDAKPGQVVEVDIGGTGRPVIGRIRIPEASKEKINLLYCDGSIMTKSDPPPRPPIPDGWDEMAPEKRREWCEAWQKTDEGKAYKKVAEEIRAKRKRFPLCLKADGSFRVEDVPAGTYLLNLRVCKPPQGRCCGWGDPIASAKREFTVAEMSQGRSDEPQNLGEVELTVLSSVEPGLAAPDFEAETLDGKKFKFNDYRDKYVLLDFWATWCGPCRGETPNIKAVFEKYKDDDRLVVLGLSLDPNVKAPKQYVEKKHLGWAQGFLGDWSQTNVPAQYGVRGIPAIFLIGPDGTILKRSLRGPNIMTAVTGALGPPKNQPK